MLLVEVVDVYNLGVKATTSSTVATVSWFGCVQWDGSAYFTPLLAASLPA